MTATKSSPKLSTGPSRETETIISLGSNDEVERRVVTDTEGTLFQSSTCFILYRSCDLSLQPIERRISTVLRTWRLGCGESDHHPPSVVSDIHLHELPVVLAQGAGDCPRAEQLATDYG